MASTLVHQNQDTVDLKMMSLALDEARKCTPKPTGFSVGCVLALQVENVPPVVLARGYSRELEGNTHAEANALAKARMLTEQQLRELVSSSMPSELSLGALLRKCTVYTTMEPCSVRTSGLAPCADALIDAGISRCFIGVAEPDDFVHCEGAKKLVDAGVEVVWLKGMESECIRVARTGHIAKEEYPHTDDTLTK